MRITVTGSLAMAVAWHTMSVSSANSPIKVPGPTMTSLPSEKVPGSSRIEPSCTM